MQNKENYCHEKCECNCSPFQARLAGIQGNISFQLFRLKGCRVRIHISCTGEDFYVDGKICNVGTDFVDIHLDEKKCGGKVITVMIERICTIEWLDKDCSPCKKRKNHYCV